MVNEYFIDTNLVFIANNDTPMLLVNRHAVIYVTFASISSSDYIAITMI